MELVFEVSNPQALQRGTVRSMAFGEAGGVIGRHPDCEWSIEDRLRLISGRHARVAYSDQHYLLIDTSRNGIEQAGGGWLRKDEGVRVHDGDVFRFGALDVVAHLSSPGAADDDWIAALSEPGTCAPMDTSLPIDPLHVLSEPASAYAVLDELAEWVESDAVMHPTTDHDPVDHDYLLAPRLIAEILPETGPSTADTGLLNQPALSEGFWQQLGEVLDIDLQSLEIAEREALLLDAARLLKQCVSGLQRALRNRDDVQAQICDGVEHAPAGAETGLLHRLGSTGQLSELLMRFSRSAQLEQTVPQAFRQLQAHQLALLAGSRALARAVLEHFSPQQLNWEFERDSSRPVINTAGSRWRAYLRFHHALSRTNDWSDELMARHFTQAYRDQLRLIDTLHLDCQV